MPNLSLTDTVLTYQFIKRFAMPFADWPACKAGIIDEHGNVLKKRETLTSQEAKIWGHYDILIANLKKLLAKLPGGQNRLTLWAALALLLKEGESLDVDSVDILQEKVDKVMSTTRYKNLIEGIKFKSAFANHEPEEGTGVPHKVDAWHQSRANGWCVQVLDKHGNQVGDAEYHYHKRDAMHARKQLMTHHKLNEEMGVAAVNNVGGGKIAGTKEAGDDPPVSKKAHKAYARKNKKFSDMSFARRSGAK